METELKQEIARPPIAFKFCSKVVKILQNNEGGLLINQNTIQLLGFADELEIISESLADTANAARMLEESVKKIGLEINTEKTKKIKLIKNRKDPK